MTNLIISIVTLFFALKGGKETTKKGNSSQKKWIGYILAGVAIWWVTGKISEANTQNTANKLQDTKTVGTQQATATALAERIFSALGGMDTIFGNIVSVNFNTDEAAIFQVAREMWAAKNYTDVADAYRSLYKRDMSKDIQADLDSSEFQTYTKLLQGIATGSPAPPAVGVTPPKAPVKTGSPVVVTPTTTVKRIVTTGANVNVRYATKPWPIFKTIPKSGTFIGEYLGIERFVVNGITKPCYRLRENAASKYVFLVASDYVKLV